ncbi:MAG: hypothetical protein NVS9B4_00310 [Candidatus Acidiferrum sp.]
MSGKSMGQLPASTVVPLSRFVTTNIFALKSGGYGCLLGLDGIDDEGVTDTQIAHNIATIRAALASIPDNGGRLYQYMRIRRGYTIPIAERGYADKAVDGFVRARIAHLDATAHFHRIDLFWCITIECAKSRTPAQHSRTTGAAIRTLEKSVEAMTCALGQLLNLRVLGKDDVFRFFSYLLNLEDWAQDRRLTSDDRLDGQLAASSIVWHPDHIRIGKRYAQIMSLTDAPAGSRPNLFGALQSIDADIIACACWTPRQKADALKRIGQVDTFLGLFRHGVTSVAAHLGDLRQLDKSIAAKAGEDNTDNLAGVLKAVEAGYTTGKYSLTVMVHSRNEAEVLDAMPLIRRSLTDANAPHMEETRGTLAAYYAMLPGNSCGDAASNFNVREFWLRDDHAADMAFAFAPNTGSVYSEDLEAEYLNVYETRAGTPYFLDPYVSGTRNTLVLGATRAGKSVNGNLTITHEQKYGGYTYVIDAGGSYESTVRALGGVVERIRVGNPRIAIFAGEPTKDYLQFLFGFIRMLLERGGAALSPEDEESLMAAISRMYLIPVNVRRLGNLRLPPHLARYLAKWIEGGAYGDMFDNVEDSLRLARVQCFDFEAVADSQQDLVEPLLFWLLHAMDGVMRNPANLGVPKHILFDELWKHLKSRQLLEMAMNSLKTGGKHLVGATLLTQSAGDLGEHADLIVNACSTFLFLPDPTFNRAQYQRLFNLNDQEVLNLASLQPREAMLKRPEYSKILKLNLDAQSLWMYSTKPKDKVRRNAEIEEFGFAGAMGRVAK